MNANLIRLVALFVLVSSAACSTPRYYDVRFTPAPVEVEVGSEGVAGSQVRVLVSVLGVARASDGGKTPAQVEMRLRLENMGTVEAELVPTTLSLVAANLIAFQAGSVARNAPLVVAPSATQTIDFAFAMPPGRSLDELDWHGLNLRFTLEFKGVGVTTGATFSRVDYGPEYYEPRFRVGMGYGYRW